jgi:hypothetical protein
MVPARSVPSYVHAAQQGFGDEHKKRTAGEDGENDGPSISGLYRGRDPMPRPDWS